MGFRRMQYWTCPLCGSNLDFGEVCDCGKEKAQKDRRFPDRATADGEIAQTTLGLDRIGNPEAETW